MRIRSYKNPSHRGFDTKCCDPKLFGCSRGCDAYFKLCVTLSASSDAHNCNLGILKTGVVGDRDDHRFDANRYKERFAFSSFLVSALLYFQNRRQSLVVLLNAGNSIYQYTVFTKGGSPWASERSNAKTRRCRIKITHDQRSD